MSVSGKRYRGRFAPTPSGPLHLGSLLTALASYLQARSHAGQWLVRIDDLDAPRCPPGMDGVILRQLEAHGLHWDGAVYYQSRHLPEYRQVLDRLARTDAVYACACTRAVLRQSARPGPDGPVYPGTCRLRKLAAGRHSLRVRVEGDPICFDDGWQGRQCRHPDQIGDFVVRGADGAPAYQLVCALDEHALSITEVVRGADLLGSAFRQCYLQRSLGLTPVRYRHLPVVVGPDGRKLSKQNHAPPVEAVDAAANLRRCLALLGQPAPPEAPIEAMLQAATKNWDAAKVPRGAQISGAHL